MLCFRKKKQNTQTLEQKLETLLKQKYLNISVTIPQPTNSDEIRVSLLNGRHGVNEGIDEENERPIEFLKSFGATVTREKSEHSYWSKSVITFNRTHINNIIQGLENLPTPKHGNSHGKIMAKC